MTTRHRESELGLDVDVPEGWEVATSDGMPLVLLGPRMDDFRANIGFAVEPLVPPDEDGFRAVVERSLAERPEQLDRYEQVSERATHQGGLPMHLLRSRWRTDEGVDVAQVGALATDGNHLWQVHCTCLRSRESEDLATFKAVLDSIEWWSANT